MRVNTNSLASIDGILVHSKYRRYRKPLLPAGVHATEFALLVRRGVRARGLRERVLLVSRLLGKRVVNKASPLWLCIEA